MKKLLPLILLLLVVLTGCIPESSEYKNIQYYRSGQLYLAEGECLLEDGSIVNCESYFPTEVTCWNYHSDEKCEEFFPGTNPTQ